MSKSKEMTKFSNNTQLFRVVKPKKNSRYNSAQQQ